MPINKHFENKKTRTRYIARRVRRRNKPSLKAVILGAIISQFSYSGYSDSVLEEPQKIKDAMRELVKDTKIWAGLQAMAEALRQLKEAKEQM